MEGVRLAPACALGGDGGVRGVGGARLTAIATLGGASGVRLDSDVDDGSSGCVCYWWCAWCLLWW